MSGRFGAVDDGIQATVAWSREEGGLVEGLGEKCLFILPIYLHIPSWRRRDCERHKGWRCLLFVDGQRGRGGK
jgi:hypothetical protein